MAISLHDGRSTRRLSEGRSADWSLGVFDSLFFLRVFTDGLMGIGIFTYTVGLDFMINVGKYSSSHSFAHLGEPKQS